MKTCTTCGKEKPLNEFHRSRGKPQGRMSRCRPCEAERNHQRYHRDIEKSRMSARAYSQTHRRTPRGRAGSLVGQAKRRAHQQNVNCTLTIAWVTAHIEQGYCSVTGIPFDLSNGHGRWKKQPFTPSIDRINAGGDYAPENCRVICLILNEAMNQWGLVPVLKLARALVEEHG